MIFRALIAVPTVALLVAACGGGGSGETPTPTAGESPVGAIGTIVEIESEGSEALTAELALPEGVESPPAVVLANAGPGRVKWRHVARALVDEGYAVLAIDIRGHDATVPHDSGGGTVCVLSPDFQECGHYVDDALRDIYAGIAYLRSFEELDGSRIGVVGVEQAGFISYLASSLFDDVDTFVSIAPHGLDARTVRKIASVSGRGPHSILYIATDSSSISGMWSDTAEPRAAEFFELESDDALLRDPAAIDVIVEWLAETL